MTSIPQLPKCPFQLTLVIQNQSSYSCSGQSRQSKTPQWTNQDLKQTHVANLKRGKTASGQARIGFGLGSHWLRKCGCEFIHPITESNNAKPRQTRDFRTSLKGWFRSYEFCLRLSLVICNIAQTCDNRGVSNIACHARQFIGLICPKHFLSWFVFCIPVCFTISCNAHLNKLFHS